MSALFGCCCITDQPKWGSNNTCLPIARGAWGDWTQLTNSHSASLMGSQSDGGLAHLQGFWPKRIPPADLPGLSPRSSLGWEGSHSPRSTHRSQPPCHLPAPLSPPKSPEPLHRERPARAIPLPSSASEVRRHHCHSHPLEISPQGGAAVERTGLDFTQQEEHPMQVGGMVRLEDQRGISKRQEQSLPGCGAKPTKAHSRRLEGEERRPGPRT